MTTRLWILLGGLAALGAGTAIAVRPSASDGVIARPAAGATPAQRTPSTSAVADVKLDLLQRPQDALTPPGRDLFRFPVAAQTAAARARTAAAAVVAPPAPVFTGPPPPPPIPLRYIGLIETQSPGRVALLSDGRGGLMHGREGDIIEGRYRMLRVGLDSVELAYTDGRGRQTIRLSGQ